jgi:adenosine deaminase
MEWKTKLTTLPTYQSCPKAELHAHLNGCVPPSVIHRLVDRHGIILPDGFKLPDDLTIRTPVATLLDYFRPWNVFKRLPVGRECLDEMVAAAAEHLSNDGVRYAELRNSPFNIAEINSISLERTLEWLVESAIKASETHNIDLRLIISLSRYNFDLEQATGVLSAITNIAHDQRIVGVDLSGNEDDAVTPDLSLVFRRAKGDHGLGVTVHAGETWNTENVRWAIEECDADRIGHCLAASNDPRLMEMLATRDICVEVCLKSNLLSGRCESLESHPIHAFVKNSVPFVLCTDNPQVHGHSLSDEYASFIATTSRPDLIDTMYDTQRRYAFTS